MTAALDVRFERDARGWDRTTVLGRGVAWSMPSYKGALPHDAVHLIVESAFELRRGLWGRVAAGADPDAVNREVRAARVAGRAARGFGADLDELLSAEALSAVHWYDPDLGEARLRDVAARCLELGAPLPDGLSLARCEEVVRVARAVRARFRASEGRGLALRFVPEAPGQGFRALVAELGRAA